MCHNLDPHNPGNSKAFDKTQDLSVCFSHATVVKCGRRIQSQGLMLPPSTSKKNRWLCTEVRWRQGEFGTGAAFKAAGPQQASGHFRESGATDCLSAKKLAPSFKYRIVDHHVVNCQQ